MLYICIIATHEKVFKSIRLNLKKKTFFIWTEINKLTNNENEYHTYDKKRLIFDKYNE
jgi:hypothetical protein